MGKYKYINEIVQELLNGTFSVFCGAGASKDATMKGWEDLFTKDTKSFYENYYSRDLYFLADLEARYIRKESFLMDISKDILSFSHLESQHINHIVNLNINQIWTTNFDCIIEETVGRKFGYKPEIIQESKDLLTADLDARFIIYKLNGSASKSDTMVITKTNFLDYQQKQRLLFEVLKRQLVLDTFLFVGYSFTDDLVLNALQEIKAVFPNNGKKHYRFVVNNTTDVSKKEYMNLEKKYYDDVYNIKTIFINEFCDIDDYLQTLYRRFCNHNVFIAGSFRQLIDNEERLYIEQLVALLIRKLTSNGFNIYSGNGRGLGEIVVAQINKSGQERHFVNRPLIFTNDSLEQKEKKNSLILKDCDTMIIICGQDDSLGVSKNVIKQFNSFINNNEKRMSLVIPIPSTGYAAKEVFNSSDFKKSNSYLMNKYSLDCISQTEDIDTITKIVLNLILSYKAENS